MHQPVAQRHIGDPKLNHHLTHLCSLAESDDKDSETVRKLWLESIQVQAQSPVTALPKGFSFIAAAVFAHKIVARPDSRNDPLIATKSLHVQNVCRDGSTDRHPS